MLLRSEKLHRFSLVIDTLCRLYYTPHYHLYFLLLNLLHFGGPYQVAIIILLTFTFHIVDINMTLIETKGRSVD